MTRKQRRLVLIGASVGVLAVAVALILNALRDSIVFFNSPSDMVAKHVGPGTRIRLGGLVKDGSLVRGDNLSVRFEVTDGKTGIPVSYRGVLPDLFREGQGVVAEGALDSGGMFKANSILAKHDEKYMPKEVADALKRSGHWKDDYGAQALLDALERASHHRAFGAHYIANILYQEMTPQRQHPPVRLKQPHLNQIRLDEPSLAEFDTFILKRSKL